MEALKKTRVESIDVLRGLVMIIMALDHVRDYFHVDANTGDPLNLQTTTPILFFTRWITHFCAPVFVFLSGTSIYLQSLRKTKAELAGFLIKRGLWLILLEVGVVTFGWTFDLQYSMLILQVIWAIGISMVLMGCIIRFPFQIVVAIGALIVLLHNLLDFPERDPDLNAGLLWDLMHHGKFIPYPFAKTHLVLIAYPFLPWTGLMMLGYGFGKIMELPNRKKMLNILGLSLIGLFVLLRFINVYGDPLPWSPQKNGFYTFLSFINVNKYPPSLLYMFITIGPALLMLSFLDTIKNSVTNVLKIYGRVALFYYLLHLFLIHLVAMIIFFVRGNTMEEAIAAKATSPFYFVIAGEGYNLPMVYVIWILIVAALYPLCKGYDRYKTNHKEKWWLSYL
jgi:uncharacterized membrane protein